MFLRDRRELSDKLLTLLTIGFGIPLSGVERLFLSRNPSFRNSFQIWGKLSVTATSRCNRAWISTSVRSGCAPIQKRICECVSGPA